MSVETTETATDAEVREAPVAFGAQAPDPTNPVTPEASDEPVLELEDIQGNIVTGFNKDHVELIFLCINDAAAAKRWLAHVGPAIASADEVVAFNRLYKQTRSARGFEGAIKSTWINIAFSCKGLVQLNEDATALADASFQAGLAARSQQLNDPTDGSEGDASRWRVGGIGNEADIVMLVASDDPYDLLATVEHIEESIYAMTGDGLDPLRSGVSVLYKQRGGTQLGALAGHEHFGWLDGVSQPGLRGRLSAQPGDVLTPRQHSTDPDQGKPGQDLLWPGEFIFGYPGQKPEGPGTDAGPDSLTRQDGSPAAPDWARNGSYLVIRRLRQDVGGFHAFLKDQADRRGGEVSPEAVGSRLVGRWPSGAPVMRAATSDDDLLGHDDCANNNFEFQAATEPSVGDAADVCNDETFPASPGDAEGLLCPFGAHIRKSYPRDDVVLPASPDPYGTQRTSTLGEDDTQTHRLLRRGIPYGPSSRSTPHTPASDDAADRGLLFMAYMTSIEDQFEFVMQNWVNAMEFKEPGTGVDPILGQAAGTDRSRSIMTAMPGDAVTSEMSLPKDWVIPTGGGYFFAPSMSALKRLAG